MATKVLGRLKSGGRLWLSSQVNERAPAVRNGLIAHFPMDNTPMKYFPSQIRYIRDWLNGSTANGGNHWVEVQAFDYNGTNVALNKTSTSNGTSEGQAATRPTDGDTNTANYIGYSGSNIWLQVDLGAQYNLNKIIVWHYYSDGRTYHNTKTEVSDDGVTWYSIFDSAVEGEYAETSAGHTMNFFALNGTTNPTGNTGNTVMPYGVSVEETTTNLWNGGFTIYNNYGVPAALTTLSETYMGQPIYRLAMRVDSAHSGNLADFQTNTAGNHGVYGGNRTFSANTKYAVSVYWRAVNKTDISVGGTASNISGWTDMGTYSMGDGWNRSVVYRDGTVTSDKSDNIYWSFKSPSMYVGQTVYIDWCCPQIESGRTFATSYVPYNTTRAEGDFRYTKVLNPSKGTVIVEVTFHEDDTVNNLQGSDQYCFGNGGNWNSANTWQFHDTQTWYIYGSDGVKYTKTLASKMIREERTTLAFVYDDSDGTMLIYKNGALSTTDTSKVTTGKFGSIGTNWSHSGHYNTTSYKMCQTIHSLTFYNRPLTAAEIKKMSSKALSVDDTGNFIASNVTERSTSLPSDSIVMSFAGEANGYKHGSVLAPNVESNVSYGSDGIWVGSAATNLMYNSSGVMDSGFSLTALTGTTSMSTIIPNMRYQITSTTGTQFRIYVPLSKLTNGSTYTMSLKYKITAGGPTFAISDWNDQTTTIATEDYGSYKYTWGTGSKATYDSTYHFMDFNISTNTTVEIWDIQLEQSTYPSAFVAGARTISDLQYNGLYDLVYNWSEFTMIIFAKYRTTGAWRISGAWDKFYFGASNTDKVCFSWTDTGTQKGAYYGTTTIPANQFVMLGCSIKNGNWVDLYYNGVREFNMTSGINMTSTATAFELNSIKPGDTNYPLNAYIKEMIIIPRALDPTTISNIYKTHMRQYKTSLQIRDSVTEGCSLV